MALENWRFVPEDDIARWRKKVRRDLTNTQGRKYKYESNTAHWSGLEQTQPNDDGSVSFDNSSSLSATSFRQPKETAKLAAESLISWAQDSREQFIHRVRILKNAGNMPHLTDEQAADKLWEICQNVAKADAQRVYERSSKQFFHQEAI